MNLQTYKEIIQKQKGKKELVQENLKRYKKDLKINVKKLDALEKAQAFLQVVAKDTQEQLKFHIADLVNLALNACFKNEYKFDINFEIKRGKTEAELVFVNKNGTNINPLKGSGGGVVDLVSLALRISAWSLGKNDNVIILDEPFKSLQPKELYLKALEIVKQISKELNIQFIIIANSMQDSEMLEIADKIFKVKKINGISKVIEK